MKEERWTVRYKVELIPGLTLEEIERDGWIPYYDDRGLLVGRMYLDYCGPTNPNTEQPTMEITIIPTKE